MPDPQGPHAALDVPGLVQSGEPAGQSRPEPEPALPAHEGVTHAPVDTLQTWPEPHCAFAEQRTLSVAELLRPALVATMVLEPSDSALEVHVQVPFEATVAEHTVVPPAVTVTPCPGTPVPVKTGVVLVVVAVPSAGGLVSATLGATQAKLAVL